MKLKNEAREWLEWDQGIESLVTNYFKDLFSSQGCNPDPILRCVHRKVTDEQNMMLTKRFVASEIRAAVFEMHPEKSPGPNGMNAGFFQAYWDIVGEEVLTQDKNNNLISDQSYD